MTTSSDLFSLQKYRGVYLGTAQAKQSSCNAELKVQAGGQGTTIQTDSHAQAGKISGTAIQLTLVVGPESKNQLG